MQPRGGSRHGEAKGQTAYDGLAAEYIEHWSHVCYSSDLFRRQFEGSDMGKFCQFMAPAVALLFVWKRKLPLRAAF